MAKLNIQSIAKVLVEKNELQQAEAEAFVAAIFDTIQSGIDRDKLVKVKGLGTFKVISVEARESINVNTGERLVIDSHDKVSFTPDSMMKELVNKPFSSFETVVLNDGVEFEDLPATTDEEESVPAAEEPVEPEVEQPKEVVEEKVAEPIIEKVAEPVVEKPIEPIAEKPIEKVEEKNVAPIQPVVAEDAMESPAEKLTKIVAEEAVEASTEAADSTPGKTNWKQLIIVAIVSAAIGFIAGMFTENHNWKMYLTPSVPVVENADAEESKDPQSTVTDTLVADTAKVEPQTKAPAAQEVKEEPAPAKPAQAEPEADYMKYDAMDQRLSTGAYYIIGTESEVEAREGDNLARVSRRYLGDGMSCYVEVLNGMPASTQLKAGQKVKIPKLIMKKTLRQRLEKQKNNQ